MKINLEVRSKPLQRRFW